MLVFLAILVYLAITNWIAYRAFERDKFLAQVNENVPRGGRFAQYRLWRISEARLLFYAIIGGWPGAKYAQKKFRHKITKQPFGRQLNEVGAIQGIALGTLAVIAAAMIVMTPQAGAVSARAAVQEVQPAGAPPLISLRPPVARPATL